MAKSRPPELRAVKSPKHTASLTLGQLASPAFSAALSVIVAARLPMGTAYRLKSLVSLITSEQTKFNDLRKELCERYCRRDDEKKAVYVDGNYTIAAEHQEAFSKEFAKLTAIPVEVTAIPVRDLGSVELSAQDLIALGNLLTSPEESEAKAA